MGLFSNRFYGKSEVIRRRQCLERTGKVVSGTLVVRGGASVAYQYVYVHPQPQRTGIGGAGYPNTQGGVTMFREGEGTAPMVDDKLTVGSVTVQVVEVRPENNADEADGWAVYQLQTT